MGLRQLDSGIAEPAVQAVPLDAIDFDDATFRVRVHVVHAELIPSLRQQGQLAPVHLRASAIKAAPLQIVCGFRRLLAMRELHFRTVQARIHGALSDEDALRLAIADNSHHDSLTDLDRGHAIALLRERHGHTLASAAATLHLSTRHTRRLEKLTEFPAALRAAISAGRLKSVHAMVIMAHFVQREVNPESAIDALLAQLPATVHSAARLRDRLKAGDYVNDSSRGGPDRVDGQAPGPRLYAVRSGGARLKPVNILPGTLDETTKAAFSRELEALITLNSTGSLTPHATAAPDEVLAADAASSVHRVTPHSGGVHRERLRDQGPAFDMAEPELWAEHRIPSVVAPERSIILLAPTLSAPPRSGDSATWQCAVTGPASGATTVWPEGGWRRLSDGGLAEEDSNDVMMAVSLSESLREAGFGFADWFADTSNGSGADDS